MVNRICFIIFGMITLFLINLTNVLALSTVSQCRIINESGTYIQIANIVPTLNDNCIDIKASNVVFNGNGFSIINTTLAKVGIYVKEAVNVTIKNVNVMMSSHSGGYGVYFLATNNSLIENSSFNNNYGGIFLFNNSNNNTITQTTINNNPYFGIDLYYGSDNNKLNNVTTNNNQYGIILNSNLNALNQITANNNSKYGIYVVSPSSNNLFNQIIANNNLQYGLYFYLSSNNTVTGVTANGNAQRGIYLLGSSNNLFNQITTNSNSRSGIHLISSSNNAFSNGIIGNSKENAILLKTNSQNNIFANISITNTSFYDLNIEASNDGTYLIDMPHIGNYSLNATGSILYVKDSRYGEIKFLEAVRGSGTNLSADIRILNNSATVRSNINPGLNRSAKVALYGIGNRGFASPAILRDGVECGSGCYNFTSLNAGTVIFNVNAWTNYSIGNKANTIKFLRGDSNGDGEVNIADAININNYLFIGTGKITCEDAADVDDNGKIENTDAICIINFLYRGTCNIKPFYPNLGIDSTLDQLDCKYYKS